MRKLFSIIGVVSALMMPLAALADAPQGRVITVSGVGVSEAAPDMAVITLGAVHQAETAKEAMDLVSGDVSRLLESLRAQGIEARDLQTSSLSLRQITDDRYSSSKRGGEIIFEARNTVTVRVRDLDRLGALMGTALEQGANNFRGLRFDIQEPKPLQDAARTAAVKDAMDKARQLADAAGVTLGPVQSISEYSRGGPQPVMEMAAMRSSADMPIAAGEVGLSVEVNMVIAIAD